MMRVKEALFFFIFFLTMKTTNAMTKRRKATTRVMLSEGSGQTEHVSWEANVVSP